MAEADAIPDRSELRGHFEQEMKEASSRLGVLRRAARQARSVPRVLAPLAMLAIVAIIAAGVLFLRAGSLRARPGPASPSPSVSAAAASASAAAGPRAAVELTQIDLPGPVYALAIDRARDSLWYVYMTSGNESAFYRYDIASGKTSQWPVPPTSSTGFLERVEVAPDGSVWVTDEYSLVRVDPISGHVATDTFPVADADALSAALQSSPGTWPSAITFDTKGMALVARHNVKSLLRLDSSLDVVDRIELPAGMVGPGDLVDSHGVIYAAPDGGTGPAVLLSEQGALIGSTTEPVSRFSVFGTSVAAIGSTGISRVASNAATTLLQAGLYGSPNDRLAITDGGGAIYLDGPGTIEWISPSGAVEGRMSFASVPIQVANPLGQMVTVLSRHQIGAITADGTGSVWYVDITSSQLVHVTL